MDVELVARRRLNREPGAVQLEALGTARFLGSVRDVLPRVGIAGIEIREDAGNRAVLAFVTRRGVVPNPVPDNGTANAAGEVPLLDQLARHRQPRDRKSTRLN